MNRILLKIKKIKNVPNILFLISTLFLIYEDILQYMIIKVLFLIYIILKSIILVENGRSKNSDLKYILKIWICYATYILIDHILSMIFLIFPGALLYNILKLFIFFAIINLNTINIVYGNLVKYRFIMYKKNVICLVDKFENTKIMNLINFKFDKNELMNKFYDYIYED